MKLFFKVLLFTMAFEAHSRAIFNISFSENIKEARKVQAVLVKYFHINQRSINIRRRLGPCIKQQNDFIEICILKKNIIKVFDRSGNDFESMKPIIKNLVIKN